MTITSEEFIPTRASLLGRLKDLDDQESWRDFYNTYRRFIFSVALKAGLSREESEEVLQETVIGVARKISGFRYDPTMGSFKGWLMNLIQWRIADQRRKRQRQPVGPHDEIGETSLMEELPDPASLQVLASLWDEEWQANLLAVATDRVKSQVYPRQFQIYQLYVLKQWPVAKVAGMLGVSRAQVYVVKHRIANLLRQEVSRLRREGL